MFLESYFRQLQVMFIYTRRYTFSSIDERNYDKNSRCGIEPMRLSFIHRQNREFINDQGEYSFLSFHFDINSKILSQVRSSTNSSLNNPTRSQILNIQARYKL